MYACIVCAQQAHQRIYHIYLYQGVFMLCLFRLDFWFSYHFCLTSVSIFACCTHTHTDMHKVANNRISIQFWRSRKKAIRSRTCTEEQREGTHKNITQTPKSTSHSNRTTYLVHGARVWNFRLSLRLLSKFDAKNRVPCASVCVCVYVYAERRSAHISARLFDFGEY